MLPKPHRLKKSKEVERVLKKGRGLREGFLVLKILNTNLPKSRFAFIVSTKVSKKAVVRNRIKRKLREGVRLRLEKIKPGIDAVFIVLPGFETKNSKEMEESLEKLLLKAKILSAEKVSG